MHILESNDPEFDDYRHRFESIEKATEKLLKDSKAYTDSVTNLFTNAVDFGTHFATVFHPLGSEYGLESRHPDAEHTIANVDGYSVGTVVAIFWSSSPGAINFKIWHVRMA